MAIISLVIGELGEESGDRPSIAATCDLSSARYCCTGVHFKVNLGYSSLFCPRRFWRWSNQQRLHLRRFFRDIRSTLILLRSIVGCQVFVRNVQSSNKLSLFFYRHKLTSSFFCFWYQTLSPLFCMICLLEHLIGNYRPLPFRSMVSFRVLFQFDPIIFLRLSSDT